MKAFLHSLNIGTLALWLSVVGFASVGEALDVWFTSPFTETTTHPLMAQDEVLLATNMMTWLFASDRNLSLTRDWCSWYYIVSKSNYLVLGASSTAAKSSVPLSIIILVLGIVRTLPCSFSLSLHAPPPLWISMQIGGACKSEGGRPM